MGAVGLGPGGEAEAVTPPGKGTQQEGQVRLKATGTKQSWTAWKEQSRKVEELDEQV